MDGVRGLLKRRLVRVMMWCAAIALGTVLGAIQLVSSVALRAAAQPGSWPSVATNRFAVAVDTLDPRVPIPPALRLVFARAALAANDIDRARAETLRLPPSRDRFALEAGIARARGDDDAALAGYLAAGDLAALQARIDTLASANRMVDALRLERRIVDRLRVDRIDRSALAEASFRLGRLEEREAVALGERTPRGRTHARRAVDAYERAATISPLSQQYLLGLGNQQLNVGDLRAAVATFERARSADPTGSDPLLGLGDAAARRGDRAAARAFLMRARAIDPTSAAAARLAHEIGP